MGCTSSKSTTVVDPSQKPGEQAKGDGETNEHTNDTAPGAAQHSADNDHADIKKS